MSMNEANNGPVAQKCKLYSHFSALIKCYHLQLHSFPPHLYYHYCQVKVMMTVCLNSSQH